MITIYHNGSCSKCGGALEILQAKGIPHEVRWYLADPLSREELTVLLKKLHMRPDELVRRGEEYYTAHLEGKVLTDEEWLNELVTHPELIQRPIVVNGDKAVVARPPESLHEVL